MAIWWKIARKRPDAYGKTGIRYQCGVTQRACERCGMSGGMANVNGCLSYTVCSYQPTEVMTLCIRVERRTSCDQLGYMVWYMRVSSTSFRGTRCWEPLQQNVRTLFVNSVTLKLTDWINCLSRYFTCMDIHTSGKVCFWLAGMNHLHLILLLFVCYIILIFFFG